MNKKIISSVIGVFLGYLAFCQPLLPEGMFSKITGVKNVNGNGRTCFTLVSGIDRDGIRQNCLVKSNGTGTETICLEEEFDLGNDEIAGVDSYEKYGNSIFVLKTPGNYFYLLLCNPMGPLVLKKIKGETEGPVDSINISIFPSNEILATYFSAGTIYTALLSIPDGLETIDGAKMDLGSFISMSCRTADEANYVLLRTKKDGAVVDQLLACAKGGIRKLFQQESADIVPVGFIDGTEPGVFYFYLRNWIYSCNGNQVFKEVEIFHDGMVDSIRSVKNCGEILFIVKEIIQNEGEKIFLYDRQNLLYESGLVGAVKIAGDKDKNYFCFGLNGCIEQYELIPGSDRMNHVRAYAGYELCGTSNSMVPYLLVKKISDHSTKIVDVSFNSILEIPDGVTGFLGIHAVGKTFAVDDRKNLYLYDGEKWNVHGAGSLKSFTETVNGVKFVSFIENGDLKVVSMEKKYE